MQACIRHASGMGQGTRNSARHRQDRERESICNCLVLRPPVLSRVENHRAGPWAVFSAASFFLFLQVRLAHIVVPSGDRMARIELSCHLANPAK